MVLHWGRQRVASVLAHESGITPTVRWGPLDAALGTPA